MKIDFDNGYIIPTSSETLENGHIKIECDFYEYGEYVEDITLEVFKVVGDNLKDIIINAVENDEYEVY